MKKMNKNAALRLLLLAMVLAMAAFVMSGCSNSPDSVEDPLSQYSGAGLDGLNPDDTGLWTPTPTEPPATEPPVQVGYGDLMFGTTGDSVSTLQSRLKALGYYSGTIDGKFGESTVAAIRLFQDQIGVQKTGLATAQLQEKLFDTSAPRYTSPDASDYDPYDGPDADDPDDYQDYGDNYLDDVPAATRRPTATQRPAATPDNTPRDLARGDKGDQVRKLQNALKALGYYTGSIDGDFGSGTATAVKRFQAMYNKPQDGIASLTLQNTLYSGNAKPYATATPSPTSTPAGYVELAWGDSGTRVTQLQRRLRALGYLAPDVAKAGTFDTETEKAVKRFQGMYGVEETGIATTELQKRLFASDAPTYDGGGTIIQPMPTPTSDPYAPLSPGDTGERVKKLQRRLKELGYFTGDIGGNYLELTTAAVKAFQDAVGVTADGKASSALLKVMFSDDAPMNLGSPVVTPSPTSSTPVQLAEGDEGEHVSTVQRRLKELGFYSSSVTGGFGPGTTAAVKAFQKACDLRQTGIVTRELYQLMMSDEAPDLNAPAVTPIEDQRYVRLSPGDTGEGVKGLQRRLRDLGYFDGDIGGNYLEKTTTAVKAFQKALGWDTTGVATIDLQERLYSKSAPSRPEGGAGVAGDDLRALKRGDSGDRVRDLQERLIELGFLDEGYGGDGRGTYGRATQDAVINAQMARGTDSDGNADLEFMNFIMSRDADSLIPIIY